MYKEKNCIIDKHKIAHINRPKFNLSNKEKNIAMVIKSRAIGIIFINCLIILALGVRIGKKNYTESINYASFAKVKDILKIF